MAHGGKRNGAGRTLTVIVVAPEITVRALEWPTIHKRVSVRMAVSTKPLARRTLRVTSFEAGLRTSLHAVVIRPKI